MAALDVIGRSCRRAPVPLRILLVIAAVHALAWSLVTAPLQGPDEESHFAYTQYLAETGHAPSRDKGDRTQSSALSYLISGLNLMSIKGHPEARPLWPWTESASRAADKLPFDDGSGPNPAAGYPPLSYAVGAAAYHLSPSRSLLGRMWSTRATGVLWLVIATLMTWLLAAEVLAATWQRTLATATVALQPKAGFMAGVVNPDIALTAIAIGALWLSLRIGLRGLTVRRGLGAGALAILAALCHPRGLFVAPVVVVAALIGPLYEHRGPVLKRLRGALPGLAVTTALGAVGVLAAVLWARAHTSGVSGQTLGAAPSVAGFNIKQFASYLWQFYLQPLEVMAPKVGPPDYGYRQVFIDSYYGAFGSLDVNLRPWILDGLYLAHAVLILWVAGLAVRRWERLRLRWPVPVIFVVFAAALMGLLHIVSYASMRGAAPGTGDPVITGRYLLPLAPIFGVAAAWVIGALPRRPRAVIVGGVVAGFAVLAVTGAAITAERYFA